MLTHRHGYVIMIMPYVIITSVVFRRVGEGLGERVPPPPIIHGISMLTHRYGYVILLLVYYVEEEWKWLVMLQFTLQLGMI